MEKHDYVICSWCSLDVYPDFQFDYLHNVTHNEAVNEAKFNSEVQILDNHRSLVYNELNKHLGDNGFAVGGFADAYEKVISKFRAFEVWLVSSDIPKEAYSDFEFDPSMFCTKWCERVA